MFGRKADADEFVNAVVDEVAGEHVPDFAGRFSLHGHSAGAQFAARYLVAHPERLDAVVLSAPSAYPFPDPARPWPDGMAPVVRDDLANVASRIADAVLLVWIIERNRDDRVIGADHIADHVQRASTGENRVTDGYDPPRSLRADAR